MMVVPTLTRHDLLAVMVASIDHPVGHLVVIDNSGRGVDVSCDAAERVTVLPMPSNLGVAGSWNLACKFAYKHPWVFIASDDVRFPAGALAGFAAESSEGRLTVSSTWPHWCAFTIGAEVVANVGLFDEGFYPAYFEDTEYRRRLDRAGMTLTIGPEVAHRNSSTLESGFQQVNSRSFAENQRLFDEDRPCGFDPFRWRRLSWT